MSSGDEPIQSETEEDDLELGREGPHRECERSRGRTRTSGGEQKTSGGGRQKR